MDKLIFGDIVILKFPYTDGITFKRRPALVISDIQDGDIIVCRITSKIYLTTFDIDVLDWAESGLKLPSVVRVHKIATLEKSLVELKLGSVSNEVKNAVTSIFTALPRITL
jgi:mRNA interferase MazF